MKIHNLKVNWMEGWGNLPHLEAVVDRLPKREELRFVKKVVGDSTLFFAHTEDGYVSFNAGTSNHRGYGGSRFTFNMVDGSVEHWDGPWSSNSMSMNQHFPASVECTIIELEGQYPTLHYAGHLLISTVLGHELDATPTFINNFSQEGECGMGLTKRLLWTLMENPYAVIGEYLLTFRQFGFGTLAESQEAKALMSKRGR